MASATVGAIGTAAGLSLAWVAILAAPAGWLGFVGGPVVLTTGRGRAGVRQELGLDLRWTDIPLGLAVGAATQLALLPAVYLPLRLLGDFDVEAPARELTDGTGGMAVLLLVVVVGIGAPVAEELFFRGLLMRAAIERWNPASGAVVTTLVFGVTHFQLAQFPGLATAGAVFALLTLRTGRLGPAICAHAGFNGVVLLVLLT